MTEEKVKSVSLIKTNLWDIKVAIVEETLHYSMLRLTVQIDVTVAINLNNELFWCLTLSFPRPLFFIFRQ